MQCSNVEPETITHGSFVRGEFVSMIDEKTAKVPDTISWLDISLSFHKSCEMEHVQVAKVLQLHKRSLLHR